MVGQTTNLAASNRRCSDPNLNESWQEHLRSEEVVAATESKDNTQQAVRSDTDQTTMYESDGKRAQNELFNDSELANGSVSVHENVAATFSDLRSTSGDVPVLNGDDPGNCLSEREKEVCKPSPKYIADCGSRTESMPNESPNEPPSILQPNISPPQDSTESEECLDDTNTPSSPSPQPACTNGRASQLPLSRQTSTASTGSPSFILDPSPGGLIRAPGVPDHLGEDGLSVHRDVVQVRLRQMEAGHQLQVETLKRQVQALWNRLHVNGELVRNGTPRFTVLETTVKLNQTKIAQRQ